MRGALDAVERGLWATYSHVYDGLLGFWPYKDLLARVTGELALGDADSLLDVGCGTGNLLVRAGRIEPGLRRVGIDASAPMLRRARRKVATSAASGPHVELVQAEALAFLASTPSASFDRVAAINVLYAVGDRARFWREVVRVLAPGGIAVVTTSTRGGSASIVREHLDHETFLTLLRPRLVGVFVIDALISLLARTSRFQFPSDATLIGEAEAAGAQVLRTSRAYGDVNILITARTPGP
jgi:ubiquinone/menaquinone biosynthesis C-methylase UbiE